MTTRCARLCRGRTAFLRACGRAPFTSARAPYRRRCPMNWDGCTRPPDASTSPVRSLAGRPPPVAQLLTFVAGDAERIEASRPVIAAYAPLIFVVGERPSQASIAKLIANFLGASALDLIGQSLAWAEKSGLSATLVQQILSGFFANPATREYVAKIGERDCETVGFTAAGGLKDVKLMIAAAQDVKLRLSSAEAMRIKLEESIARGWRDKDWSCFTDIDRSLFRSDSAACRGLRTEFRPFSRVLRLKSPASLSPQNSVSRMERPDLRLRVRQIERGGRIAVDSRSVDQLGSACS